MMLKRLLRCTQLPSMKFVDIEDENESNAIIKQAYCKHRSKGTFHSWKMRYIILYDSGPSQTKKLRIYKNEKFAKCKDPAIHIPLDNVEDIVLLKTGRGFQITIAFMHYSKETFIFSSEYDTNKWYEQLNLVCFGSVLGRVAKDYFVNQRQLLYHNYNKQIQNRLLEEAEVRELFKVYLYPSLKLKLHGEFLLQIISTQLRLLDVRSPCVTLVSWEIDSLRMFGYDNERFTFESGSNCLTGQGIFVFKTMQGESINHKLQAVTRRMSNYTQLRGEQLINISIGCPQPTLPDKTTANELSSLYFV